MEMHHKLRRDPTWDPKGCNLCGQLGHMAAMCPNGTVNWKQIYGEEAFLLRPPIYESELMEKRKAKQFDAADIERRAREYAQKQQDALAQQPAGAAAAGAAGGAAAAPAAAGAPQLPPDWAVAHNADGKPYYWNKATRVTTWSLEEVMKHAGCDVKGTGETTGGPAASLALRDLSGEAERQLAEAEAVVTSEAPALPVARHSGSGSSRDKRRQDHIAQQQQQQQQQQQAPQQRAQPQQGAEPAAGPSVAAAGASQRNDGGGGGGSRRSSSDRRAALGQGPGRLERPSLIDTYDELGGTDSAGSGTPKSPRRSQEWRTAAGRSASGNGVTEHPRPRSGGRRIASRGPSGLLGQDSESTITGTCSSGNDSPRKRCGSPLTPNGSTLDEAGGANTSNNTSGNNNNLSCGGLNVRALAGGVVGGDQDTMLGWRPRTTGGGSFSMDGASDVGTSQPGGAGGRGSFESRRNMSLQQLQKAIKSIMLTDGEMYAKLQAGLQGIGSLARETHQLTVNRDVTGATCINQYVVVKTLGRGSYGKVKLCLNTLDGQLYAIKMMNRSFLVRMLQRPKAALRKSSRRGAPIDPAAAASSSGALAGGAGATDGGAATAAVPGGLRGMETMADVSKEIAILKKMDHPNVVKLFEVIDPPGSQYMMLVMEYLEKGPVLQTRDQAGFDRLPEEVAADYFRQAIKGLEYLHYHKVVHGDIKPENLLVSANGELKISDFGCSRMADGKTAQQRLSGTPAFTAPELVAGTSSDPFAADVWAMGACLYCFIYGQLPFQGGSVLDIFKAITNEPLELPGDVLISRELRDLLHRLFDKNPAARISVPEIMAHPWVTDGGQLQLSQPTGGSYGEIEVTAQEQQGAIDRASLVSMIRARLKEKCFRAGEYLFKQGQTTNCVYFIMSGTVEVLKVADPDHFDGSLTQSAEHSFTIDIDESLTLDCANLHAGGLAAPMGVINGRLHIDRNKARDMRMRHRSWMETAAPGREVVVEIKGPGQVVGEVVMEDAPPPCRYSSRARGDVVALKLTQENYLRALAAMYFEAESGARATAGGSGGGAAFAVLSAGGALGGLSPVMSNGSGMVRSDLGARQGGGGGSGLGGGGAARMHGPPHAPSHSFSGAAGLERLRGGGGGGGGGAAAPGAPRQPLPHPGASEDEITDGSAPLPQPVRMSSALGMAPRMSGGLAPAAAAPAAAPQ
ncbi:MAG: hypothetical protein J3K34DRAFT_523847 [Monoraphidium minutum]|nr:MAG: hypothetical protein J3K34DRAFT_523847 [Monoraphidium minutum]